MAVPSGDRSDAELETMNSEVIVSETLEIVRPKPDETPETTVQPSVRFALLTVPNDGSLFYECQCGRAGCPSFMPGPAAASGNFYVPQDIIEHLVFHVQMDHPSEGER
jgi:hypothetical protein